MMGDMHHVHRGIRPSDVPLYDDTGVQDLNSFTPAYQQVIPGSHGVPVPVSWSATDPTLLLNEQSSGKGLLSWQAESCVQQSLQYSQAGFDTVGHVEMMAALNADPYKSLGNYELTQLVQLYSTYYQDPYPYSNLSFSDSVTFQPDVSLPTSSDCLQVVSSSGSDSLSTTETWRSETSGGCAPSSYENVLTNLNESSSVTLVRDSHDSNFQPQRPHLDMLKHDQAVSLPPVHEMWIQNQIQAGVGRNTLHTVLALTQDMPSYDVLPVKSSSDPPTFKRPRTWGEALQQGSAHCDSLRHSLASKTSPTLDSTQLSSLSRSIPSRQFSFQGKLSPSHLSGAGGSTYSRLPGLPEEGRLCNGKPAATSVEPQSVAARHRRKKISERIRVLEKLIPGGNKMDTATMLDEAIEYVKFLQLQVQILESDTLDNAPLTASNGQNLPLQGSRAKQGLKRKGDTSLGGDSSPALSVRAATSPLILSEVLQQQLFKQKLCLVSIRQCPPRAASTQAAAAPSVLRKN
ncbi:uncharacterized protein [Physcomitrium patens]|uniref:BHLH domain-containing protein n=1 Tax=Physcomitrium patens TaxID=3218 RepID=A0A2K1J9K3_PHYPA|nr:uncharacterized protein LOC112293319 [Physcomitrium patens]PNR38206.1 hypothetical protein PHYPA_021317 [Physcomitrium patens]|eukprot:XP_024398362.1 uncharacterized protein LOC112293319 [Physcomitrella patens]